jgi:hypothetical protein
VPAQKPPFVAQFPVTAILVALTTGAAKRFPAVTTRTA